MKINWGTGIILAFIGFIAFIMYFVLTMNVNKKYDHDLVNENYYKAELEYQKNIEKEKNAKEMKEQVSLKKTNNGLLIVFPKTISPDRVTGKVFLYRPSNKQFDFETPISLSDQNLLIPDNRLLDGRWNIYVDWEYENKSYLFKKEIIY